MESANFDEANVVLGPPKGVSEDEVRSLNVFRGTDESGATVVVSCWKPTGEELREIARTGRVWLVVCGATMPPVCLRGMSPFK